ncbi:putative membrane protein [Amorphus suaedae]
MSDPIVSGGPAEPGIFDPGRANVQLVYGLYLASFVTGITAVIGVILAHMNRGKATGWVESHYVYAIRTFWIGILYGVIAAVLAIVVIGVFIGLAAAVWFIVRCVKGLIAAGNREAIANPTTWWI